MTETLTIFFCFLENPLKMLKALVAVFWHGGVFGDDILTLFALCRVDTIITRSSEIRCFYPACPLLSIKRFYILLFWTNGNPVRAELTNSRGHQIYVLFGGCSSLEADQTFRLVKNALITFLIPSDTTELRTTMISDFVLNILVDVSSLNTNKKYFVNLTRVKGEKNDKLKHPRAKIL